jgi:hypothetical protein
VHEAHGRGPYCYFWAPLIIVGQGGGDAPLRQDPIIDLATATLTVAQSLEQTREGLRFKSPKTPRSRRSIALPAMTVDALRSHRAKQAEERLALGVCTEISIRRRRKERTG